MSDPSDPQADSMIFEAYMFVKVVLQHCQCKVEMSCVRQSRNVAFSLVLSEMHVNLLVPVKRRRALLRNKLDGNQFISEFFGLCIKPVPFPRLSLVFLFLEDTLVIILLRGD